MISVAGAAITWVGWAASTGAARQSGAVARRGALSQVIGPVVDVRFDSDNLPDIMSALVRF
jgi:ATP synthase alpha/beta family, beta-barrel domain